MSVWVQWRLTAAEDRDFSNPITEGQQTLLGPWAEIEGCGADAAKEIVEDFVRHDRVAWELLSLGDDTTTARIEIMEPAEIAGRYEVDLELKIVAWGARRNV